MARSSDRDSDTVALSAAQLAALADAIAVKLLQPVMWLTPERAAEVLGVPAATLAQWRYRGQGPRYSKVGAVVRYARADLDAWLAAAAVEPHSA